MFNLIVILQTIKAYMEDLLPHAAQECNLFYIYNHSLLANTSVTMCGCSSSKSPAYIFPSPTLPTECLSSGLASSSSPFQQPIYSQTFGALKYTCVMDSKKQPNQDCMNTLAHICNPAYLGTDQYRIANCKNAVDTIFTKLNPLWQAVRRECGQWPYAGYTGDSSSEKCASANAQLRANVFYSQDAIFLGSFTSQFTESLRLGLWTNQALRG